MHERLAAARRSQEFARFSDLQLEERRWRLEAESLRAEFELLDAQLARQETEAAQYREEVATRHRAALVSAQAQDGLPPIRTVAEAVAPSDPMDRNLPRRVAIAALMGLLFAVGFAALRELG